MYDGHGTVRALADIDGSITDTYSYDAFGNLLKSTGETANNYRYCGEQFDSTTGLYYLRARYMDTSTGRFISQDSYAGSTSDPVSLHKYLYANSNPVMYSDPSGYMSDTLVGQTTCITIQSVMYSMYQSAASAALAFFNSFMASLPTIMLAVTGFSALLINNPAFVDICLQFANGNLSIYDLNQEITELCHKASEIVNNFINGSNNSSGGSNGNSPNLDPNNWRELLSRAQQKAIERLDNIINDHLKPSDFEAVKNELNGIQYPKPNGGYWNHIAEMKDSYIGLQKSINTLQGTLQNPNLSDAVRTNLTVYYNQAIKYIEEIEEIFAAYGGINAY